MIDGAKNHLSIQASEFCYKNDIVLYVLYPNAMHLIQPMDLVLMNSIKTVYKEELRIWLQKNLGVLLTNIRSSRCSLLFGNESHKKKLASKDLRRVGFSHGTLRKSRMGNWHHLQSMNGKTHCLRSMIV